jgi:nucleoside-diphosphate-sugar epimerase
MSILSGKKVLVAGSEGLIGKEVVKLFKMNGAEVSEFDIRPDKVWDIRDPDKVDERMKGVDVLVHVAGMSRPAMVAFEPLMGIDVNCRGTRNLYRAVMEQKHPPVVVKASSREVYGNRKKDNPASSFSMLRPGSVYALTHMEGERLTGLLAESTPASIVRFSNVYGGDSDYEDRVVPAFLTAAFQDEDDAPVHKAWPRVSHDGAFDFVHVSDAADAVFRSVRHMLRYRRGHRPMLAASGVSTSLPDLARMCMRLAEKEELFYFSEKEWPDFGVHSFHATATDEIREALGWAARVELAKGLKLAAEAMGVRFGK